MGKHVKAYKVSFNITGSYIQAQPSQIIKRISSIETWDNLICQMSCTIVTTGILSIAFPSINIMDASSSLERHCSCRGAHYCNAACISDGRGGFFFRSVSVVSHSHKHARMQMHTKLTYREARDDVILRSQMQDGPEGSGGGGQRHRTNRDGHSYMLRGSLMQHK